jgi:hypothetical protein
MEDDEDFLAAVEADNKSTPVEPEKVEEPKPEPAEEPKPEPEPKPEEAAPEVLELTTEEIVQPKPDAADGRLIALLEERDKRKAAEERLRQLEEQARQTQAAPVQMPDPYEDPEGFAAAQEARVSQALYQTNLRWSEQLNSIKHGEETVKAAKDWGFQRCESDPYFNAKVASSADPIGFVVSEYKREEIASKVTPDEFAQFQAWKEAQGQLTTQPGGKPPDPPQTSAIPSPSIASAPSAGSILTEPVQSDEDIFKEVIGKR